MTLTALRSTVVRTDPASRLVIAAEIFVELGGGCRQHGLVLLQGHVHGPEVGQQMGFGRVA